MRTTNKIDTLEPIISLYHSRHTLCMVTVYTNSTLDFPGEYVARLFLMENGQVFNTSFAVINSDLEAVRRGIPKSMTNIGRQPADEPVILEVWV